MERGGDVLTRRRLDMDAYVDPVCRILDQIDHGNWEDANSILKETDKLLDKKLNSRMAVCVAMIEEYVEGKSPPFPIGDLSSYTGLILDLLEEKEHFSSPNVYPLVAIGPRSPTVAQIGLSSPRQDSAVPSVDLAGLKLDNINLISTHHRVGDTEERNEVIERKKKLEHASSNLEMLVQMMEEDFKTPALQKSETSPSFADKVWNPSKAPGTPPKLRRQGTTPRIAGLSPVIAASRSQGSSEVSAGETPPNIPIHPNEQHSISHLSNSHMNSPYLGSSASASNMPKLSASHSSASSLHKAALEEKEKEKQGSGSGSSEEEEEDSNPMDHPMEQPPSDSFSSGITLPPSMLMTPSNSFPESDTTTQGVLSRKRVPHIQLLRRDSSKTGSSILQTPDYFPESSTSPEFLPEAAAEESGEKQQRVVEDDEPKQMAFNYEAEVETDDSVEVADLKSSDSRNDNAAVTPEASTEVTGVTEEQEVQALLAEGIQLYQEDDLEGALEKLQYAAALHPTHVAIRNNLGVVLGDLERFPEAIEAYKTVLRVDPTHLESHFNVGSAYRETKQLKMALKHFNYVVQQNPTDSDARTQIRELTLELGVRRVLEMDLSLPEEFQSPAPKAPESPSRKLSVAPANYSKDTPSPGDRLKAQIDVVRRKSSNINAFSSLSPNVRPERQLGDGLSSNLSQLSTSVDENQLLSSNGGSTNEDSGVNLTPAETVLSYMGQIGYTGVFEVNRQEIKFYSKEVNGVRKAKILGKGGFGVVLHGRWRGIDVAVKKMLPSSATTKSKMEFVKELALMARLSHPNIIQLLGACTDGGEFLVMMQYMNRGDLFHLMHGNSPDSQEVAWEKRGRLMCIHVARGLTYLHESTPPIIHRDIKSINVLIDESWVAKLSDVGLAGTMADFASEEGATACTPAWAPPEVLRGQKATEKSDMFSFGVILWEVSSRRVPWRGVAQSDITNLVGTQGRRLEISRSLPLPIKTLITSCWLDNPKKRPSAERVLSALEKLGGSPRDSK